MNTLHSLRPGNGILLMAGFCLILLVSCKKEDSPDTVDCTGLTPTYTSDIKTILDASCAKSGCHDAISMANNFNLGTYTSARNVSQGDRFLGAIQNRARSKGQGAGFVASGYGS